MCVCLCVCEREKVRVREGEKEREIETRGGKSRFNVFIGDAFKTKSPSRADLKTFLLPKIFFILSQLQLEPKQEVEKILTKFSFPGLRK